MTTYTYDVISRLNSQNLDFAGTANDQLIRNMVYNPASQLTSVNRTNDAYAWTAAGSGSTTYVPNGLNQYTGIGGAAPTYDANGNMLTEPQSGKSYAYSSENLLTSASGGGAPAATLTYDPLMRLYEDRQTSPGAASRLLYDGTDMIAEYDASNTLQKRYVFGAGTDEPLVELDAAGNRTWMTADERGSIIARSDDNADVIQIDKYDEYGKPQPGNSGRFQYTGQAWLDDLGTAPASGQGLYYYKSRMYAPHLGRFMQPDSIGYAGGLNLYAYVLNDPVNYDDPMGRCPFGTRFVKTGGSSSGGNNGPITVVLRGYCAIITLPGTGITPTVPISAGRGDGIWSTIKRTASSLYCSIAPHPNTTLQASATGVVSLLGVATSAGYTIAIDRTGSLLLFKTAGGYKSLGGGAGLSFTAGASSAERVRDLSGRFYTISATSAEGGGLTGTAFTGSSRQGPVVGAEAGVDIGLQDSVIGGVSYSIVKAGVSCP